MKQTAVEWLEDCLVKLPPNGAFGWYSRANLEVLFKQAIEMEKEQLEYAWNSSDQNMRFQFSSSSYKPITFKQWLEIFKEE